MDSDLRQRIFAFCNELDYWETYRTFIGMNQQKYRPQFLRLVSNEPPNVRCLAIHLAKHLLREAVKQPASFCWRLNNYLRIEQWITKTVRSYADLSILYARACDGRSPDTQNMLNRIITNMGQLTPEQYIVSFKQLKNILRNKLTYPVAHNIEHIP